MTDTTIGISEETQERLKRTSFKGETYDELVNRLLDIKKEFDNEAQFRKWFKNNYHLFGFTSIIKDNVRSTPDFVMKKGEDQIRVELETVASNFLHHGHNPENIDMVLCLLKDKELGVKTIEIDAFNPAPKETTTTTVGVSKDTVCRLKSISYKGETYDELINRLLSLVSDDLSTISLPPDFFRKLIQLKLRKQARDGETYTWEELLKSELNDSLSTLEEDYNRDKDSSKQD